jgi:hypothetical protein
MRCKRHDSINRIIVEIGPDFESLDACSALQHADCVFLAARIAAYG